MSTSASKSQVSPTTTTIDRRVAADNGAIVLAEGATLEQLSDDVALAAIETTGDVAQGITRDSLSFASEVVDTGIDVVSQAIRGVQDTVDTNARLAESLSTVAIENLEKNKRDADADTIQTVAQYAAGAAAIVGVAFLLRKK